LKRDAEGGLRIGREVGGFAVFDVAIEEGEIAAVFVGVWHGVGRAGGGVAAKGSVVGAIGIGDHPDAAELGDSVPEAAAGIGAGVGGAGGGFYVGEAGGSGVGAAERGGRHHAGGGGAVLVEQVGDLGRGAIC